MACASRRESADRGDVGDPQRRPARRRVRSFRIAARRDARRGGRVRCAAMGRARRVHVAHARARDRRERRSRACAAIVPGIGAEAALLAARDRARRRFAARAPLRRSGARRRCARRPAAVRWFAGWAAINGGGPKADAASRDWHMDRTLRIGTEGGRLSAEMARRQSPPAIRSCSNGSPIAKATCRC